VGDVLKNDPVVRTTRGFGSFQESYMIRGFIANSDDLMYNGLFGILPRQYVASEMIERVEVLYGASAFSMAPPRAMPASVAPSISCPSAPPAKP
jgi:iron complex outermembrane receptor protein